MNSTAWACFIYYRLSPQRVQEPPWGRLFAQVRQRTGVCGRLYGPAPDGQTWMEVYEPIPADQWQAFESALKEALVQTGFEGWLAKGESRHVESFPQAEPAG